MGLRLSPEKTLITPIDEGLDFLGWRIQRHRKRGTGKSYVYIYPAKKALVAVLAKVATLCRQSADLPLDVLLHRLNRMLRGWTAYFKYGYARDLQLPEVLPVETGHQVARAQASAHRLETAASTLRQMARRRWRGTVRPGSSTRQALLLPGSPDPDALAEHSVSHSHRSRGACGEPGAL